MSGAGKKATDAIVNHAARNEEFFRQIYYRADAGIAITDLHGVFQACNPGYCALLGYSEEELRSINFAFLIHPEDREADLVQVRRVQAGEISSFDIENRYIRKNGEPVWVHKFLSVLPGEKGGAPYFIALVTDTTWRHSAEEMLRASEARLRMALDASGAGTWSYDLRTNELQWDERLRALYGFPPEMTPSLESWIATIHQEDLPRLQARISEVMSTPGLDTWNSEFRAIRPDGTEIWIQNIARAERQGPVVRLSGINVDITERKRREANSAFSADVSAALSDLSTVDEIMQKFGSRIAGLLRVSSVTYWDVDDAHNEARLHSIWAASDAPSLPAFVRLSNYLSDDFARALRAGETIVIRDTETDPRVDAVACRALRLRTVAAVPFLQEGKWRFSFNLFDPSPRDWREDEVALIEELAKILFPCLERARAEEALRESEERYRGLAEQVSDGILLRSFVDNAGDGIYVLDRESGRILDANNRAVRMLGYSRDELLKLSLPDVECEHPLDSIPDFHRAAREVVVVEGVHRRKDGSRFPVETRLTSLAPVQPQRVLAIVRDVTERKQAEAVLRDETRRKDEFLALLGHELRNPLAAISTAAQAILTAVQLLSSGVTGAQRASLNGMMERQAKLMQRLLDDLIDLGRIRHGHIQLKKGLIDLARFLQHLIGVTQSTTLERQQEMIVRLPTEAVIFLADEARLEQIAINLLNNASKYTAKGGRIEFSGAREGSEVVLRCKDNGLGIPVEMQEKIFEPFVCVGPLTHIRGEASLGIGLALVKQLVELHGGRISVESGGTGTGSEFVVRLPLELAPSDPPAASEPKLAPTLRRSRLIVVVEDNSDVVGAMSVALQRAGYRVRIFSDAVSALAGLSRLKPHAVLLDIGLPEMDGYELAAKLKHKRHLRRTLFIGLSGFKRRLPAGSSKDFDHYLNKPVDLPALLTLLDAAC